MTWETKARNFGQPLRGQNKVKEDVAKVATNLGGGACRLGYVIVFAECDYGLGDTFVADTEASSGCRVRFIRGW